MKCAVFEVTLEEWMEIGEGQLLPAELQEHVAGCVHCRSRAQAALRSRVLLRSLRTKEEPMDSPYFAAKVLAGIRQQARRPGWGGLRVAGRDLVLATALFGAMLGSFIYNFQRTERPNSDEAMALDVPHTNPMHPADDHARPRPADAMLSLMNP